MNTDNSTNVIARIGPVISPMAFLHASGTESCGSSSITRSMFSTTTMASSTTMPMARTSANSRHRVLAEYPTASRTAKVPTIDTGTATKGIRVVLSLPRNRNTTSDTRMMATTSVRTTSLMVALTTTVVS